MSSVWRVMRRLGYDLRGRVPSVEETIGWEVSMSVVHTDRANLLFVTLNAVRRSNVISE